MKEKKDLRIIKTKIALYSALEKLMKDKPFEEIKVADICTIALINRSTFYAHYTDKYELFSEYINTLKDALGEELKKNTNINNTKEYYLELIKILLDHIEEKKGTYLSIMINNKNSITMDILDEVITKTIINQINNEKNKIPNDIISKFYIGGVTNICMEWLKYDNKYTKEEIISYINYLIPDNLNK